MNEAWIDANIILRHLTQEPPDQAARVMEIMTEAEAGTLRLRVDPITVAECVWVLTSLYHRPRSEVASVMAEFVGAEGVVMDELELMIAALRIYDSHNIDFADALLASKMAESGVTQLFSFDRDFDRIPGITRSDPGAR